MILLKVLEHEIPYKTLFKYVSWPSVKDVKPKRPLKLLMLATSSDTKTHMKNMHDDRISDYTDMVVYGSDIKPSKGLFSNNVLLATSDIEQILLKLEQAGFIKSSRSLLKAYDERKRSFLDNNESEIFQRRSVIKLDDLYRPSHSKIQFSQN